MSGRINKTLSFENWHKSICPERTNSRMHQPFLFNKNNIPRKATNRWHETECYFIQFHADVQENIVGSVEYMTYKNLTIFPNFAIKKKSTSFLYFNCFHNIKNQCSRFCHLFTHYNTITCIWILKMIIISNFQISYMPLLSS